MGHVSRQGWVCAAVLLVACWAAMPTSLPNHDAGEFTVLSVTGGVAHPTGYPLWTLLVRAAATLRGIFPLVPLLGTLAALCGALAALVMHRVLEKQGVDAWLSAFAVWGVMLAAPSWRNLTVPEPFALNVLLAAGVVAFASQLRNRSSVASAGGVGLMFGLGFCNHHTLVLLLPWALWRLLHATPRLRHLGAFSVGSALGLLPLLSFFTQDPLGPHVWGDWSDPAAQLLRHVLRAGYGTFALSQHATRAWWATPWLFVSSAPVMLSGVFLLVILTGITVQLRTRAPGLGVTLTALCIALAFTALFHLGGNPAEDLLVGRFFVLPLFLLAPAAASGLGWAASRVGRLTVPLCVLTLACHVFIQWPQAERVSETFQETHGRNVMALIRSPALVVTAGDNDSWALYHARDVLGLGGDVVIVPAALFHSGWYLRGVCRQLGIEPNDIDEILAHALHDRNVYTLTTEPRELQPLLAHSYPLGPLVHLLRPSDDIPDARTVFNLNVRLVRDSLTLPDEADLPRLKAVDRILLRPYVRPWSAVQPGLLQAGLTQELGVARQMEQALQAP